MAQANLREFLYRALSTPHGIALSTDDPQRLVQKLNLERRESGDPSLKRVIIATSRTNPEREVWLILKQEQEPIPSAEENGQAAGGGDDKTV